MTLRTLENHLEVLYGAGLALLVVVLLTPAVGGMARLLGVVDSPGGRRLNRRPIPRPRGGAPLFRVFRPAPAVSPPPGGAGRPPPVAPPAPALSAAAGA